MIPLQAENKMTELTETEYVTARDHILCAMRLVNLKAAQYHEKLCADTEAQDWPKSHNKKLQFLIGHFYDGLAYGNW